MSDYAPHPTELLELAQAAAREAGDILLGRFGREATGLATKSSETDMVSDADRAAEEAISAAIWRERPGDAILGEEGGDRPGPGSHQGRSRVRWVVDPLDGTTNWLYGQTAWAVSIAAEIDGELVAGVVHAPARRETFIAATGKSSPDTRPTHSGRAVQMTSGRPLVATGFSYDPEIRARQGEIVAGLLPRVRDIRREGSAALDLASVSVGRVDAFYETPLEPWDTAAGTVLVREAGGVVVHLDLPGIDGKGVLAANADLATELGRMLLEVG